MPGSVPATSQLDWLISMTAMIVLSWSRATRDLLKACPGAGRGRSAGASLALHRLNAATKLPFLAARPIASLGPSRSWIGVADAEGRRLPPVTSSGHNDLRRGRAAPGIQSKADAPARSGIEPGHLR